MSCASRKIKILRFLVFLREYSNNNDPPAGGLVFREGESIEMNAEKEELSVR